MILNYNPSTYTKQNLFSDLSNMLLVINKTDLSKESEIEKTFDYLEEVTGNISLIGYQSVLNPKIKLIHEIVKNYIVGNSDLAFIKNLKSKLLELKDLVQAEIEKEVQPDLIPAA